MINIIKRPLEKLQIYWTVNLSSYAMRLAIFSALLTSLILIGCSNNQETTNPHLKDITESVYASVRIEPKHDYYVYAETPGILESLFITEGDTIKKGDLLARIKTDNDKLGLDKAITTFQQAKTNYLGAANELALLETEIQLAQQRVTNDSINYVRQVNLWEQKVGTEMELDQKALQLKTSRASLMSSKQKYKLTKSNTKTNYELSQTELKKAQLKFSDNLILAQVDGIVLEIFKKQGDFLSQQEGFARIANGTQFKIDMLVDEVDIAKIGLNQEIVIDLEAYPKQPFKGKVNKIYPAKDIKSQSFKIEGVFSDKQPLLYAGMAGEANIIISKRKDVLVIPTYYLSNDGTVNTSNGIKEVKTGVSNLSEVEIISGLDTNSTLIKSSK